MVLHQRDDVREPGAAVGTHFPSNAARPHHRRAGLRTAPRAAVSTRMRLLAVGHQQCDIIAGEAAGRTQLRLARLCSLGAA